MRRRPALIGALAVAAAALGTAGAMGRGATPRANGRPFEGVASAASAPAVRDLPWRLVVERLQAGGPNGRLGLVQAQHIYGRVGAATGFALLRSGLVRVRIPANLARLGDDGWRHDRFEDGWWMERMRDLGVPFKAVVELWPRFSDEMHAEHAARVVRRVRPDAVIVGNELNVAYRRPGANPNAEVEQYAGQYAAIHAAVRAERPETSIQLYGEAYDGDPSDGDAVLRRVLSALRQRSLPPPDAMGIHVYDRAAVLPARVAGYRRLLADYGLRLPVSVEELGPRQGVVDAWEVPRLRQTPALDARRFANRVDELRADGWLAEEEQANLVAQHLATAAACAEQAQVFCAIDFDAEITHRRGLVSNAYDRQRPALAAFRFMQRLLNDVAAARLTEGAGGVRRVTVQRREGLEATIYWREPAEDDRRDGAAPVEVPPFTFVSDALGRLVAPPQPHAHAIELPPPTSPEAGGAVRVLI